MAQVIRGLTLTAAAVGCLWLIAEALSPTTDSTPQPHQPARAASSGAAPLITKEFQAHAPDLQSTTDSVENQSNEMWNAVLRKSGLNAQWLQSHGFTQGSEALERLYNLLDGAVTTTNANAKQIGFGPQGSTSQASTADAPTLSTHERYVDASLPTSDMAGDSVLMRWRNISDNQVIELSAQALPSGAERSMPLWMYSPTDWAPGRYRLEVLAPNPDLGLLAAGEFTIAASNAAVTPFAYEAQAQLSSTPSSKP